MKRFIGSYAVEEFLSGKVEFNNPGTRKVQKKCLSICRLKEFEPSELYNLHCVIDRLSMRVKFCIG